MCAQLGRKLEMNLSETMSLVGKYKISEDNIDNKICVKRNRKTNAGSISDKTEDKTPSTLFVRRKPLGLQGNVRGSRIRGKLKTQSRSLGKVKQHFSPAGHSLEKQKIKIEVRHRTSRWEEPKSWSTTSPFCNKSTWRFDGKIKRPTVQQLRDLIESEMHVEEVYDSLENENENANNKNDVPNPSPQTNEKAALGIKRMDGSSGLIDVEDFESSLKSSSKF